MPQVDPFFTTLDEVAIRDAAANSQDLFDWIRLNRPFSPGMETVEWTNNYDQPTQVAIDSAVAGAMADLPSFVAEAGLPALSPDQLAQVERIVKAWLPRDWRYPSVSSDSVLKGADMGLAFTITHDHFFATIDGKVDTALFTLAQIQLDADAAKVIAIIDIILEVIGLILGALGLAFPKADAASFSGSLAGLIKSAGFKAAFQALLQGLKDRDPKAIIIFLNFLRAQGVLSEVLSKMLGDMDWIDWAIAIAKFLAFLGLALGTAGGGAFVKLAVALLNAVQILNKIKALENLP